jgi:hypothetical protein
MELEASSVPVNDPGDPNLGKHQESRSNGSGKQIPQELSLSEIVPFEASHESSGIPDQELQEVESRDLSTVDQVRAKKTPTDSPPPKRKSVYLHKPYRGEVTCDEVISILGESQLDELCFGLMNSEEDGSIEAYKQDRLHLFQAIGKCESLKSIEIAYGEQLHVEEISALRPTLEERIECLELNVSACDERGMTNLCEMLAKNNVLKDVLFKVGDGHLAVLCEILPTLSTSKPIFNLSLSQSVTTLGAASLVSILGMTSIVRSLDINDERNLLGSNGLEKILDPLIGHGGNAPANQSVNELNLRQCDIGRDGGAIKAVVEMLRTNMSLTKFSIALDHTLKPELILDPLTGHSKNPPLNRSLKELIFDGINIGGDGAIEAIAEMLRTNNSLTKFSIVNDQTLKPSNLGTILSSLKDNRSLLKLGFPYCNHVEGPDVLGKMMDLLRVNPWLTEIDLKATPLEREGKATQVRAQLERNAQDYMKVLRGMPPEAPKFAKVFLCGHPFSGKSLYFTSIKNIFSISISYEANNVCSIVHYLYSALA